MRPRRTPRTGRWLPALFVCFCAGGVVGWLLHAGIFPKVVPGITVVEPVPSFRAESSSPTTAEALAETEPLPSDAPISTLGESESVVSVDPIEELRHHDLKLPIKDVDVKTMMGSFSESRSGTGGHRHEAVDILAPRNTPVRAVEDGTIAKLFFSKAGGTTIYEFDPTKRFCYYYAHLQRYADGLHEGQRVEAGDVIGYVGTSGNAPPGTPHLHFAIFALGPEKKWWQGRALDPYLVFQG